MSLTGTRKTATIAINTALSGAIDLGRYYDRLKVELPVLTSCTVSIQTAATLAGTYQSLGVTSETTIGSESPVYEMGGAARYIKIATSVNQGAARTIYVTGIAL